MSIFHLIKDHIERDARTYCGLRGVHLSNTDIFEPQQGMPFNATESEALTTCPRCLAVITQLPRVPRP